MYFYYFKHESKIIQIPKISDVFKNQNKIINKNLLLPFFLFNQALFKRSMQMFLFLM